MLKMFEARSVEGAENTRERINIYRICISLVPQNPRSANASLGCWTIDIAYEDEAIMEKVESHITSLHTST